MADPVVYNFIIESINEVIPFNAQTNEAYEFHADSSINIMPIPSNYGLITWDGSVLTVS